MSKLIEKLKQASEVETQPLGFGAKVSAQKAQMILMVSLTEHDAGIVASAAVLVFSAFEDRFAAPNTMFMVHEVAMGPTEGMNRTDVKNLEEMFGQLTDRYIDILVNITNKNKKEWEQLLEEETYFFADEAKEWGLVTEVK